MKKTLSQLKQKLQTLLQETPTQTRNMILAVVFVAALIIFLLSIFIFTATHSEEAVDNQQESSSSKEMVVSIPPINQEALDRLGKIVIDGNQYEIPFKFSSLTNNGLSCASESGLRPNESRQETLQRGQVIFQVTVTNNSDDYLDLEKCDVTRFVFSMEDSPDVPAALPGNLNIGMKSDEFLQTYGAPSHVEEVAGVKTYNWVGENNTLAVNVNSSTETVTAIIISKS